MFIPAWSISSPDETERAQLSLALGRQAFLQEEFPLLYDPGCQRRIVRPSGRHVAVAAAFAEGCQFFQPFVPNSFLYAPDESD